MEKIIFKVNDLRNGQGLVNRLGTFIENLNNIRQNYYEELKAELNELGKEQIVKFEIAGRYVVLIEMKKNWDIVSMIFFDLQKDEKKAKGVMKSILKNETDKKLAEELAQEFVFAFVKNKYFYDRDHDLIELELDTSEMN